MKKLMKKLLCKIFGHKLIPFQNTNLIHFCKNCGYIKF